MKKDIRKRLYKTFTTAVLSGALIAGGGSLAFAEEDNNGGGDTSGRYEGAGMKNVHTAWSPSWNSFVRFNESHGLSSKRYLPPFQNSPEYLRNCQKARSIFWMSHIPGKGNMKRIFSYNARGVPRLGYDGIDAPWYASAGWPSASDKRSAWDAMNVLTSRGRSYRYWYDNPGSPDHNKSTIVAVCSKYDYEEKIKTIPYTVKSTSSFEKLLPYSYMTTVAPRKIQGKYVGGGRWESQAPSVKKTNFSKVYDELAAGDKGKLRSHQVADMVNRAAQKDAKTNFSTHITLTPKNQEAFARGGIIDVSEFTKKATVRASTTVSIYRKKTCKVRQYYDGRPDVEVNCWGDHETGRNYYNVISKAMRTPFNSAFWQQITVHCNIPGFDKLVAQTGARVISKDEEGGKISAVARSKYYTGTDTRPAKPVRVDFGQPGTESGTMGFYDKECSFTCTPDKNKDNPHTLDNLGTVGDTGDKTQPMKNGADVQLQHLNEEKQRGNNFTLFRDNKDADLHLDMWYPKANSTVKYKGESALTTTVTRWLNGTPDVRATKDKGGKFTIITKNGNKELFTGDPSDVVPNQRNWDTTPFTSTTTEILPGVHNWFKIKGSWASEVNRPNILNVKWEYAPTTGSQAMTRIGTYRIGDTPKIWADTKKEANTPIQGKCYAQFGSNDHPDRNMLFNKNTGTGAPNNLDNRLIDGLGDGHPANVASNLVLKYVRAVGE